MTDHQVANAQPRQAAAHSRMIDAVGFDRLIQAAASWTIPIP